MAIIDRSCRKNCIIGQVIAENSPVIRPGDEKGFNQKNSKKISLCGISHKVFWGLCGKEINRIFLIKTIILEFTTKWEVPYYIYSQETFPKAVSGCGYIITKVT